MGLSDSRLTGVHGYNKFLLVLFQFLLQIGSLSRQSSGWVGYNRIINCNSRTLQRGNKTGRNNFFI